MLSLRPITLPVLCPRFGRVRVFRMRTRARPHDGRTRTITHGLIQIGTLQRRPGDAPSPGFPRLHLSQAGPRSEIGP
eukprot:gene2884-biopygen11725